MPNVVCKRPVRPVAFVEAPAEKRPVTLEDVVINDELMVRRIRRTSVHREKEGMHALAREMSHGSKVVLKRLAELAVELCDAGSAGVSVLEEGDDGCQIFRWQALAGDLEQYQGGSTPRDWSPCGESLNAGKAMLYSYPARFFTYFNDVDATIVEGLVIPMYASGIAVGTIWVISHDEHRTFDAEDVRIMSSLGCFASETLRIALLNKTEEVFEQRAEREVVWGEWVRRISHGDQSALAGLYDETSALVFGSALRILGYHSDAEEIVTDVYTQVWKTASTYDPKRGCVSVWLMRLARSRAIDRLRSRSDRTHRSEIALSVECSSGENPETSAALAETRRHIRGALRTLPCEQRRAIELAYFHGYSNVEVAEQLGHPLGTVKTWLRTGMIKLRRLLATAETRGTRDSPGCRTRVV